MKLEDERSFALAQLAASLNRHSAIGALDLRALQQLPAIIRRVRARELFVNTGDYQATISVLVSGTVARIARSRDGEARYTALYMTGDICDIQSVIRPYAQSGMEALTAVILCSIPREALLRLAEGVPALAMAFWRATAIDESRAAAWLANLNKKAAISRVAHLVCEIGVRTEQALSGHRSAVPWALTQQQLADIVGVTAIHVNRTLQALKSAGLIRAVSGRIDVPDWHALAKLADFDERYLFIERPDDVPEANPAAGFSAPAQRH